MEGKRFSTEELYQIRNAVPIDFVIQEILKIPNKVEGDRLRFLCPKCKEFKTGIDEKTNLSRCFLCENNFNTIEIVMQRNKVSFVDSVKLLQKHYLEGHKVRVWLESAVKTQIQKTVFLG